LKLFTIPVETDLWLLVILNLVIIAEIGNRQLFRQFIGYERLKPAAVQWI
jgi:hypothetical protein